MTKVITIVGTRPEIIRLSRVIPCLNKNLDHKLIHTGQNYDYKLSEIFFEQLRLPRPNYFLKADNSSLGKCIGEIIIKTENILKKEKPDAILILGDTNSGLSALIAKRMNIPIYHMEAGNRSFDLNVPEEINRKTIDHLADFNIVYTEHGRRNLIAEGIHPKFIYLSGSPMKEVLDFYASDINKSKIHSILSIKEKEYILASIHREENTDNINRLSNIINTLKKIGSHYQKEIILPLHPRTKDRLNKSEYKISTDNIKITSPIGYFDYVKLQKLSFCTISDSGSISEESSLLDFPAVTLRRSLERPEALDNGSITISTENFESLIESINISIGNNSSTNREERLPIDYSINNTSQRILNLIVSFYNRFSKIRLLITK